MKRQEVIAATRKARSAKTSYESVALWVPDPKAAVRAALALKLDLNRISAHLRKA